MDEMKLKIRLEAETAGYDRAISASKDKLADLAYQGKLLKQGERDITKAINDSTKAYGESSEVVQKLKTDLVQNLRAQQDVISETAKAKKELKEQQDAYEKLTKSVNQNTSATSKSDRSHVVL